MGGPAAGGPSKLPSKAPVKSSIGGGSKASGVSGVSKAAAGASTGPKVGGGAVKKTTEAGDSENVKHL